MNAPATGKARARQWNRRAKAKPPSSDDAVQAGITAAVKAAVVDSLRPLLAENQHRLLRTLQDHEVEAVAVAAISAYVKIWAEYRKQEDDILNDRIDDLWPALSV